MLPPTLSCLIMPDSNTASPSTLSVAIALYIPIAPVELLATSCNALGTVRVGAMVSCDVVGGGDDGVDGIDGVDVVPPPPVPLVGAVALVDGSGDESVIGSAHSAYAHNCPVVV
jgi:hypothetical protein